MEKPANVAQLVGRGAAFSLSPSCQDLGPGGVSGAPSAGHEFAWSGPRSTRATAGARIPADPQETVGRRRSRLQYQGHNALSEECQPEAINSLLDLKASLIEPKQFLFGDQNSLFG